MITREMGARDTKGRRDIAPAMVWWGSALLEQAHAVLVGTAVAGDGLVERLVDGEEDPVQLVRVLVPSALRLGVRLRGLAVPVGDKGTADPLQLAVYRLAWAEMNGLDPADVSGAFYYVRLGEVQRFEDLPGRDELETALWQGSFLANPHLAGDQ